MSKEDAGGSAHGSLPECVEIPEIENPECTKPISSKPEDATDESSAAEGGVRGADHVEVFSRAVDISAAAWRAQEAAREAADRAAFIEELALRAQAEAKALHDVASGLAATATSVALVALEICQFRTIEDAFNSDRSNAERISFDDFREVLESGYRKHKFTTSTKSSPPAQQLLSPTDSRGFLRSRTKIRTVRPQISRPPGVTSHPHKPMNIDRPADPMIPTWSEGSGSGSEHCQRRYSSSAIVPPQWTSLQERDSNSALETEKFPSPLSVDVYKESLAASIDSKTSIAPLWEDRYCDPAGVQRPLAKVGSDRWTEKKAMRQFQIRMKKLGIDSESSAESLSTGTDASRDHDVNRSSRDVTPGSSNQQPQRLPGRRDVLATDYRRRRISTSDSENDFSSDSEIEQILMDIKDPKLRKLRDLDQRQVKGCRLAPPKRKAKVRAVSPLLSNSEKDFYTVSGEESCPNPAVQKHVFVVAGSSSVDDVQAEVE